MTILDAFGLVALLAKEPAAPAVRDLLRGGDAVMMAVNLAEALDAFGRLVPDISEAELHERIDPLLGTTITVVAVTTRHSWTAARLRRKHYRRRDSAVSIADCLALAGCGPGDRLATADPALLAMAEAEGAATIRLLDSRGR